MAPSIVVGQSKGFRMKRWAALLFFVATFSAPVFAAEMKTFGTWTVSIERDHFDETKSKVIALVQSSDRQHILAVRCLGDGISFALGGDKYTKGDMFLIKFRGDKKPIVDSTAMALSDTMMQVQTTPEMFEDLKGSKEYAFRVLGDTSVDMIFRAGSGAARALAAVSKACPKFSAVGGQSG